LRRDDRRGGPEQQRAAAAGPANFATGVKEIHRKRTPAIASAIAK
jgi:hypothetical protein